MTAEHWPHRHLLDTAHLSLAELEQVMTVADRMAASRAAGEKRTDLAGARVTLLFYEASTRTRVSFELAARALGAELTNVAVAHSSVAKGESLVDTVRTLDALGSHQLIVRHARSGAAHLVASVFAGSVVNAGDGWHAHPTQALADLYTLRGRLPRGNLAGARVAIVGDILHSRVARSNLWSLTTAGAELRLCGPATLLRGFEALAAALAPGRRVVVTTDLRAALRDVDAVMCLRFQTERMDGGAASSLEDHAGRFAITSERLRELAPNALVLHPGPMNEGVEIAPDAASGERSVILDQVRNGVSVRMAVLALLAGRG